MRGLTDARSGQTHSSRSTYPRRFAGVEAGDLLLRVLAADHRVLVDAESTSRRSRAKVWNAAQRGRASRRKTLHGRRVSPSSSGMTALFACGHHAGARAAPIRVADPLRDDLGVDAAAGRVTAKRSISTVPYSRRASAWNPTPDPEPNRLDLVGVLRMADRPSQPVMQLRWLLTFARTCRDGTARWAAVKSPITGAVSMISPRVAWPPSRSSARTIRGASERG